MSGSNRSGNSPSNLPRTRTFITSHDQSTGKAIVHSEDLATWGGTRPEVEFNVVYTTSSFPASLDDDEDIKAHQDLKSSGKLGLVRPGGTVCRMVDFGPGNNPMMHRTQSLDYGVVLEGSIEMLLDSGEVHTLNKGDVAIQRATMHAWRNPSPTEWCRMLFVLQDCKPVKVGNDLFGEDISAAAGTLPPSRKD